MPAGGGASQSTFAVNVSVVVAVPGDDAGLLVDDDVDQLAAHRHRGPPGGAVAILDRLDADGLVAVLDRRQHDCGQALVVQRAVGRDAPDGRPRADGAGQCGEASAVATEGRLGARGRIVGRLRRMVAEDSLALGERRPAAGVPAGDRAEGSVLHRHGPRTAARCTSPGSR